ncbi:MAG: type II toxin-antitoxin system VapC family toxin [Actinomycetota bacterium]|nr:type II toxin-antitoxin system VapC family toxin [Actinomycetota bacterium]
MAIVYFDSSALVKLVLDEPGSDLAAQLWNACDTAVSSRLAHPEVCAALAAAGRNHDLTGGEVSDALEAWGDFWASMRLVELSADIERAAGELAVRHRLRGADAVHLSSSLALSSHAVTVAVWDERLHAGAVAAGLAVAPAILD